MARILRQSVIAVLLLCAVPAQAQVAHITGPATQYSEGGTVNFHFRGEGYQAGTYRNIKALVEFKDNQGAVQVCQWVNTNGSAFGDDDRIIPVQGFETVSQNTPGSLVLPAATSGCLRVRFIPDTGVTIQPIPQQFYINVGSGNCGSLTGGGPSQVQLNTTVKYEGTAITGASVAYVQPDNQDTTKFGATDTNGVFAHLVASGLEWRVYVSFEQNGVLYQSMKTAFVPTNQTTAVLFDIQEDGTDAGPEGGTSGSGDNWLLNGLMDLLKKLFIPRKEKLDAFMAALSELWNWGPFQFIGELVALQNTPASEQAFNIEFPKITGQGFHATEREVVPFNFNAITSHGNFALLRMVAGATVWLGFAVFLGKQMMPKQVV